MPLALDRRFLVIVSDLMTVEVGGLTTPVASTTAPAQVAGLMPPEGVKIGPSSSHATSVWSGRIDLNTGLMGVYLGNLHLLLRKIYIFLLHGVLSRNYVSPPVWEGDILILCGFPSPFVRVRVPLIVSGP